ncbi:MAG: lytic transglycosylase domain-containing protein [Thermodesulfovibrionales bacterium]
MKFSRGLPFILSLIGVLIFCTLPVFADQPDGRGMFRKGRLELAAGRYSEAVQSLQAARKDFPLLGDYAALYLADAYRGLAEHGKALDALRSLIAGYPDSPLMKKARSAEVREAGEIAGPDFRALQKAYVRDYPDDEEMNMLYALYLKQSGDLPAAQAVFRGIYTRAGAFSGAAAAELGTTDIKVSDLIERAAGLARRYDFKDAEKELRKALQMDDGRKKDEILKNLGHALFRQKEYKEAAAVYGRINDLYSKSRSLYRAGDKQGFDQALTSLLERNDRRAGSLLIAAAGDKRRAGEYGLAIKLYNDVLEKFPSDEEDALWGIGWTSYLAGEYKKAAETFSRLNTKFSDPKYLYWQARSAEAAGEDSQGLYNALARTENNFYAFLAQTKSRGRTVIPASYREPEAGPLSRQPWMERIEALRELEMTREAAYELSCATKKVESQSELLYIVNRLYDMGEFKKAVSLATKMPYSAKTHRLWYPLAFWDQVQSITKKFEVDPMVALSVMREESRFDAEARSVAGARGLMQVMPATAYRLDRSLKLGIRKDAQVNDIKTNISLGVFYLKSLSSEFRSLAHALAAYNAGEAAVRRWDQEGRYKNIDEFVEDIPYPETRNYVKKVLTSYFQYRKSSPAGLKDPGTNPLAGRL